MQITLTREQISKLLELVSDKQSEIEDDCAGLRENSREYEALDSESVELDAIQAALAWSEDDPVDLARVRSTAPILDDDGTEYPVGTIFRRHDKWIAVDSLPGNPHLGSADSPIVTMPRGWVQSALESGVLVEHREES